MDKSKLLLSTILNSRLLTTGIILFLFVSLFGVVGGWFIDPEMADVGAGYPSQPPSWEHWLGTDQQGRDVLSDLLLGTPQTLKIGLIAAFVGVGIGTIFGFVGGYFGGKIDVLIRLLSDVFMTIPGLLILIVIASLLDIVSTTLLGFVIATFGWMGACRVTRAQVLTMRERAYVQVAKLNGVNDFEVIFKEMLPNLLPFILVPKRLVGLHPFHLPSETTFDPSYILLGRANISAKTKSAVSSANKPGVLVTIISLFFALSKSI